MPSPFPGMNPFLEHPYHWPDFHNCFIVMARGEIARQLPDRYVVRTEERLILRELSAEETDAAWARGLVPRQM